MIQSLHFLGPDLTCCSKASGESHSWRGFVVGSRKIKMPNIMEIYHQTEWIPLIWMFLFFCFTQIHVGSEIHRKYITSVNGVATWCAHDLTGRRCLDFFWGVINPGVSPSTSIRVSQWVYGGSSCAYIMYIYISYDIHIHIFIIIYIYI